MDDGHGDRVLAYGDSIYIEDLKSGGLIRSDGEISNSLFVVTYNDTLHPLAPRDLQHCSFIVEPAHQYAAQKAFDKKLREHASLTLSSRNWRNKLDEWNPIYGELERSESQVKDEKLTNEMEAKRMFGELVTYGSVVQLRQTLSGALLTQCKKRAAHDILAMEVALQMEGVHQSLWRIIPAESALRDGEKVRFKETVCFENFKIRSTFLSTYSTGAQHQESFARVRSGAPSRTAHDFKAIFPSAFHAFELNSSASADSCRLLPAACHARILKEIAPERGSDLLLGCKAVTFRHKQLDLLLAYSSAGVLGWIPKARSWIQLEKVMPSAMWQVMPMSLESSGGALASTSRVVIQHLCSGKILSLASDQVAMVESSAEAVPCVWTLTAIRDRNSHSKYLQKEETVTVTHPSLNHRNRTTACLSTGAKLSDPWAGGTAWDVTVKSGDSQAETDMVQICMLDDEQVRVVDQVRQCAASTHALLKTLRESCTTAEQKLAGEGETEALWDMALPPLQEEAEETVSRLSASFSVNLRHLSLKCTASDPHSLAALRAKEYAQHLMRELGILHDCVALVRVIFEGFKVENHQVGRMPCVRALCRQCYSLLERACAGNIDNKRAMVPEVPAMHQHIRAEVGAYATLLQLYRGTEALLHNIDDSVFTEAVASLRQTRSARVLMLVIETSHCNGHAIKRNQDRWVQALLVEAPDLVHYGKLHPLALIERRTSLGNDSDDFNRLGSEGNDIFGRTGSGHSDGGGEMVGFYDPAPPLRTTVPASVTSNASFDNDSNSVMAFGAPEDPSFNGIARPRSASRTESEMEAAIYSGGSTEGMVNARGGGRYMLKMLEVFQALVRGRNQFALSVIRERAEEYGISYASLVTILREQRVPASIAKECCKLIIALYIDCEDHAPVELMSHTRVWSKVRAPAAGSEPGPEQGREEVGADVDKASMFQDLKEVLIDKLALFDARLLHGGVKAEVAVGMMDITASLLKFGFFHTGAHAFVLKADLKQLRRFVQPLLNLLNDDAGSEGSVAKSGAQDIDPLPSPGRENPNEMLAKLHRISTQPRLDSTSQLRMKALELLLLLVQTGWTERVHLFFDRFENELASKFNVDSWQVGLSLLEGNFADSTENSSLPKMQAQIQAPRWRRSSKVMNLPINTFKALATKPWTAWMEPGVGWGDANMAGLEEALFDAHPLFPDLSVSSIEQIGSSPDGRVPRVVALLLQLVRHQLPQLQEKAFRLLVVVFAQHASFVESIAHVHFICHPESARLLEAARMDVTVLSREVRNLDAGPTVSKTVSDHAFEACGRIVDKWTEALSSSRSKETVFGDVQTILGNLGVDEVVLSVLHLQLARKSGLSTATLDTASDPRLVQLFAKIYPFIGWMCLENPKLQERMLDFRELLCAHIAVRGLHVESVLEAIVKNNLELLVRVGQDWIRMYANEVIGRRRNALLPQWFDIIRHLLSCKGIRLEEYQILVTTLFKAHQDHLEPFFYHDGAGDWDRRVSDMAEMDSACASPSVASNIEEATKHCPFAVHLAMLELLADSSRGASPGPELYASSLFSLKAVVLLFTLWNTKTTGFEIKVSLRTECKVKSTYLNLLLHVYLGTKLVQLRDQIRQHGNGFWDLGHEEGRVDWMQVQGTSLMRVILADLRLFKKNLTILKDTQEQPQYLAEQMRYVFGSVCPLLICYFNLVGAGFGSCVSHAGWDLAHEMYEEVQGLQTAEIPLDLEQGLSMDHDPGALSRKDLMVQLLHNIRHATRDLHSRKTIPLMTAGDQANKHPDVVLAELLSAGAKSYRETLARSLGVAKGLTGLVGAGMRRLALMLARDDNVSELEEPDAVQISKNLRSQFVPQLKYGQVLFAVSRMCESDMVGEQAVIDGLRIMRLGLYLAEPAREKQAEEECESKWQASLRDEPMEKELGQATLCWLQNKYDALGCTRAALSLISHPSRVVQLSAMRQLLAQLQGCNRSSQRTIANYFKEPVHRERVFESIKETLNGAFSSLREIKRNVKERRNRQAPVFQRKTSIIVSVREVAEQARKHVHETEENWTEKAEGIGRQSVVMFSLVLLQFFCEGQYTPLQDLVGQHTTPQGGGDVLKLMIDLFCTAQLLLSDSMAAANSNSYSLLGLCVQLVETISEACQGPHRGNLEQLLNSPFLAAVNRLFLSITYDFSADSSVWALCPDDAGGAGGDKPVDINSLRCWLRTALLSCVLVLFEGVRGPTVAESVLRFIDVRTLFGQIVNNGALLGLTNNAEDAQPGSVTGLGGSSTRRFSTNGSGGFGRTPTNGGSGGFGLGLGLGSLYNSALGQGGSTRRGIPEVGRQRRLSSFADSLHLSWRRNVGGQRAVSEELKKYLETETFSFYILAMLLQEHCALPVKAELLRLEEGHPALLSHLQRHTWHVELLRHDRESHKQSVEKVFFKSNDSMDPIIHSSNKRRRIEEVLFNIPRGNPREQAKALLKRFRLVLNVVTWEHFASQSRILLPLIRNRERLDVIPLRIAFLMTLLLLLFYGIPYDPNADQVLGGGGFYSAEVVPAGYKETLYAYANRTSDPDGAGQTIGSVMDQIDLSLKFRLSLQSRYEHAAEWRSFSWAKWLVLALAALHVLMSGLTCVLYLVIDVPITWMDLMSEVTHKKKQAAEAKARRGATRRKGEAFLRRMPPLPVQEGAEWRAPLMAVGTWKLLFPVLYRALTLCLSILGMIDSPFFIVACTLDIFRQREGQLVVQALVLGGPNLVRSFMLGLTVICCCGFYSYAYFSQTVIIDQQLCHSPFQCVMIHILQSLNSDLGEVFSDDEEPFAYPGVTLFADVWLSWRTTFVALAIIFWVFLLQGILQGQIIDAFAQMRNELAEKKNDLESKCIVTSLHRFDFSGYPGEWEQRSGGKLVWNYLMYLHRLMLMEQEEFNGMENFVHSCFEVDDVSFLPVGLFLARQNEEIVDVPVQILQEVEQMKRSTQEQLDHIQKQQETLVSAMRWKETLEHIPRVPVGAGFGTPRGAGGAGGMRNLNLLAGAAGYAPGVQGASNAPGSGRGERRNELRTTLRTESNLSDDFQLAQAVSRPTSREGGHPAPPGLGSDEPPPA